MRRYRFLAAAVLSWTVGLAGAASVLAAPEATLRALSGAWGLADASAWAAQWSPTGHYRTSTDVLATRAAIRRRMAREWPGDHPRSLTFTDVRARRAETLARIDARAEHTHCEGWWWMRTGPSGIEDAAYACDPPGRRLRGIGTLTSVADGALMLAMVGHGFSEANPIGVGGVLVSKAALAGASDRLAWPTCVAVRRGGAIGSGVGLAASGAVVLGAAIPAALLAGAAMAVWLRDHGDPEGECAEGYGWGTR
jgi:hypothetical protein